MLSFLRRFFTLTAFDVSTESGRSQERYRRIAISVATSGAAQATSIAASLVLIPVTLGYLGPERYGLWVTIISVANLLSLVNFGVSNGLISAISESDGRRDRSAARAYVSASLLLLTCIALGLTLVLAITYGVVPWARLFNVESSLAASEAGPAAAVLMAITLLAMPVAVVQKVRAGYQETFINGLWLVIGTLLSLIAVLSLVHLRAALPWIVFAMGAGPVVSTAVNGVFLFRRRRWLLPSARAATMTAARRVAGVGAQFFFLQIAIALAYGADNIFVARLFGAETVTEYSVTFRLFSVAPLVLGMALQPLWPAYGEALARGDTAWARRTLLRSLAFGGLITVPPSVILVVIGESVLQVWVGGNVTPSRDLLLGCATWAILTTAGGAFAAFMNGANRMRFQVLTAIAMAAAAVAGKILLPPIFGVAAVIWSSVVAQALFVLAPTAIYIFLNLPRLPPDGASPAGRETLSMP